MANLIFGPGQSGGTEIGSNTQSTATAAARGDANRMAGSWDQARQAVANAQAADEKMSETAKLLEAATGYERWALEQRLASDKEARTNAWNIAKYQTDMARKTAKDQLANDRDKWQTQAGLDAASTGAKLSQSADDVMESAAWIRGMGAVPGSQHISGLLTGKTQGTSTTQSPTNTPNTLSLATIGKRIAGEAGPKIPRALQGEMGTGYNPYADLNGMTFVDKSDRRRGELQQDLRNIGNWAPQAWESLYDTEQGYLNSVAKSSGLNPKDMLEKYKRSRSGNSWESAGIV